MRIINDQCYCFLISLITGVDLTLRWSYDNGTTWPGELEIWPKASGYSVMTSIPGGISELNHIFILYEKGIASSTDSVSFVKLSLYGGL